MRFNDAKNERKAKNCRFFTIVTLFEQFKAYFYWFLIIYISNLSSNLHLYSIYKIHVTLIYTKKYYQSLIILQIIYRYFNMLDNKFNCQNRQIK